MELDPAPYLGSPSVQEGHVCLHVSVPYDFNKKQGSGDGPDIW